MSTRKACIKQQKVKGGGESIKAHMFHESWELLLELHNLHQPIYIRDPAQENSHPVLTFQVLDVTPPLVARMCTLQTDTAQSQIVGSPSNCFVAQSHLEPELYVGGCNRRCLLGEGSKETSAHLTELVDRHFFCLIWQQVLQCTQLLFFNAHTLYQLVLQHHTDRDLLHTVCYDHFQCYADAAAEHTIQHT